MSSTCSAVARSGISIIRDAFSLSVTANVLVVPRGPGVGVVLAGGVPLGPAGDFLCTIGFSLKRHVL